MVVIASGL